MTKVSLCHTVNHRDLLSLFRSNHQRCSVEKSVLKNFVTFNKNRLQHWCFPVEFAKVLRMAILKNSCERVLLFVVPQNAIPNSKGEFGLDETLTECKVSIFLCYVMLCGIYLPSVVCNFVMIAQYSHWKLTKTDQTD